jgi:hypothetical protein
VNFLIRFRNRSLKKTAVLLQQLLEKLFKKVLYGMDFHNKNEEKG